MSANEIIASTIFCGMPDEFSVKIAEREADCIISAFTAAGYRIVGPGDIDADTVEWCIEVLEAIEIVIPLAPGAADGASIVARRDIAALRALISGGPRK